MPSDRFVLVAVASMNLATGLVVAVIIGPLALGADAGFYQQFGQALRDGGQLRGALYPPLAAVPALALTLFPPAGATLVMSGLGLTALVAGWWAETRTTALVDRILLFVAVISFGPVVFELILGQTTLLIGAALYPVLRHEDNPRRGIALGIAMAVAPKPLLVPIALWMLVYRRRALATAVAIAVVLTGIAIVVLGLDRYAEWLQVLLVVGRSTVEGTLALSLSGNISLWPLDPLRMIVAVAIVVTSVWAVLKSPDAGLVAAMLAGLLLAPYTGLYAVTILLLAVKPALKCAPRATRALSAVANPMVALAAAFVPWALVCLAAVAPWPSRRQAALRRPSPDGSPR